MTRYKLSSVILNSKIKQLLDLYATTVFLCSKSIDFSEFAVITACNPNGKLLTLKENEKLNHLLKQQIKPYESIEIIGASPNLTHQEPSFAVDVSLPTAIDIAKKFKQNAIFWVSKGEVFLVSSGLSFQTRKIGSFNQRSQCISD